MKKTSNHYDVVVIGGGASGMMSAITASEGGHSVLVLEKNKRLGEKLRISGGGRCNIWNEEHDKRLLLANYGDNSKFLFGSFARFGLQETIDFFHRLGLKTKVEAKNRAFPLSEKADDVVDAMENKMKKLDVSAVFEAPVTDIDFADGKLRSVSVGDTDYTAHKYIFATGGLSRPETGSTGDGLSFLEYIGHKIAEPTPTITPLEVKEQWIKLLTGNTLKNVRIQFYKNDKKAFRLDGDILCTHFGISGPLILNSAHKVSDMLADGEVTATIDLYPKIDEKELDQFVISQLEPHGAKQLKNTLKFVCPDGVTNGLKVLLKGINLEIPTGEITKEQRLRIVRTMKAMPVSVIRLMGFNRAVVADGGVDVQEIDMKTMRSLKAENVYITGDLLNINRPSGGFSLQLCWTSGYLAGSDS